MKREEGSEVLNGNNEWGREEVEGEEMKKEGESEEREGRIAVYNFIALLDFAP